MIFNDTCAWVISMPTSSVQLASVRSQLAAAGLSTERMRTWTGLPLVTHPEQIEPSVREAARACVVPPSYMTDTNVSSRWHGTIGSSLAHLLLLRHVWRQQQTAARSNDACASATWALVAADDVALLPGFYPWLDGQMSKMDQPDFVNLAVVRAWGEPMGRMGTRRVSGRIEPWPQWSMGRAGVHRIRNPNILVSAYMVRVATLPTLLASFGSAERLSRRCSIDQVLGRIEYALASAHRYASYNIDAERSRIGHCAVGPEETALWEARSPERHAACQRHHAPIYGRGSRSHTRRRRLAAEAVEAEAEEGDDDDDDDDKGAGPQSEHVRRVERVIKDEQMRVKQKAKGGTSSSFGVLKAKMMAAIGKKHKVSDGGHAPGDFSWLPKDAESGTDEMDALGCAHDFHVPYDRVVSRNGVLTTLTQAQAGALKPDLDEEAWKYCAK